MWVQSPPPPKKLKHDLKRISMCLNYRLCATICTQLMLKFNWEFNSINRVGPPRTRWDATFTDWISYLQRSLLWSLAPFAPSFLLLPIWSFAFLKCYIVTQSLPQKWLPNLELLSLPNHKPYISFLYKFPSLRYYCYNNRKHTKTSCPNIDSYQESFHKQYLTALPVIWSGTTPFCWICSTLRDS